MLGLAIGIHGGVRPASAAPSGAEGCGAPAANLLPLGPEAWWLPGAAGDANADNRGFVVNLVLARHRGRLWALGSGPTPRFARALDCALRERFGRGVDEVIDPWARAELVLGNAGLPAARISAHETVAAAMAEQCDHCVARLRQRLGVAAGDLGDAPVRLPTHTLRGTQGALGPFEWWALPRAPGRVVTVWRHRASGVTTAHGLLWTGSPPDGRDGHVATMRASTERLLEVVPRGGRWIGEQGGVEADAAVVATARYWRRLEATARHAVEGGLAAMPAIDPAGLPAGWLDHPYHALNVQRVWRQVEDDWLGEMRDGRRPAR
ncbi:MAG: hypothetical protein MUF03_03285 [Rubrivivax sp.]|jgi:hypothetical protein|nr:hypothetical protein [Rubrivivax sp.]